jgi:hypothetical protein
VIVVDLATGKPQTVPVGHDPYGVVLNGSTAYVTNQGGNTVSVLDIAGAAPVVASAITMGTPEPGGPQRGRHAAVRGRGFVGGVAEDDLGAILRQPLHDGAADAPRTPCHHGFPVTQRTDGGPFA